MDARQEEMTGMDREKRESGKARGRLGAFWDKLRLREMPLQRAVPELVYALLGFLFGCGALPFGAVPLGVGLLCSVRDRVPAVAVGLFGSLFMMGRAGWIYGGVYLFALTLRLLFSLPGEDRRVLPDCDKFFHELPALKISTAALAGLAAAVYQLIIGGFHTSGLLFGGMMVLVCPASAALFGLFEDRVPSVRVLLGKEAHGGKEGLLWQIGLLSLSAAVVYVTARFSFFGLSLSVLAATAVTVYASLRYGGIKGLVAGGVCGLAYSYVYAPAFALLGCVSGVLMPVGLFFSLSLGVASGAVWSSFVEGLQGVLTVLPEMVVVAALTIPLAHKYPVAAAHDSDGSPDAALRRAARRRTAGAESAVVKLSAAFDDMWRLVGAYRESVGQSEGGQEYRHTAGVLRDVLRRDKEERTEDKSLASDIRAALAQRGYASSVSVTGKRVKRITAAIASDPPSEDRLLSLRRELEVLCGCRLTTPTVEQSDGVWLIFTETDTNLQVSESATCKPAAPGEVSGDSLCSFVGDDGRFYAVLSDGEGTGEEAAAVSGLATVFTEKLLRAGCAPGSVCSMLHTTLLGSEQPRSTTMDMFALDLYDGSGMFYKAGAAHSYIVRGERLYRVKSRTVPLGMGDKGDVERTGFQLEQGDRVVMLSDGVASSPDECGWLEELLGGSEECLSPAELSARIADAARERRERADDITVAVLDIGPALRERD